MAIVLGAMAWVLFIARTLFDLATLAVISTVRTLSYLWAVTVRRAGDNTELCPAFEPQYLWMGEQMQYDGVRPHCGHGHGHAGLCGRWKPTSRADMEHILGPENFARWAKHVDLKTASPQKRLMRHDQRRTT
ncbi:hypothetical protein [Streptomyces sp. NPDC056524]|uniref:hypothetical protein n=1 Tax=Streptomyces sp. NPDC056524 TaxID=3345851 RepID=UPI0036C312D4